MAISTRTAGTWEAGAANATSYQYTIPTHQSGDLLLLRFFIKPSNGTSPSTLSPSIDQSWTLFGNGYTYTTVSGNGSGSVYGGMAYKVATSASETGPTLTFGTSTSPSGGVVDVYQKGSGESWVTPVGIYLGFTATSSISVTMGSNPGVTAGDFCIAGISQCDNNALSSPTFTQTGVTYGTVAEWPTTALSTANGNDLAADGCYRAASSGTASAAPVITCTSDGSDEGIVTFTRLRVQSATSASAGVATGTGSSNNDTAKVEARGTGVGTSTGTALAATGRPGKLASATLAEATGSAVNDTAKVQPNATPAASGTGAAGVPLASVKPNAAAAEGTGTGLDATADTGAGVNDWVAGLAEGTGAVLAHRAAIAAGLGLAHGRSV